METGDNLVYLLKSVSVGNLYSSVPRKLQRGLCWHFEGGAMAKLDIFIAHQHLNFHAVKNLVDKLLL